MVYGLDYDGVIADTSSARAQWVLENLEMEIKPWLTDRSNLREPNGPVSKEDYARMVEAVFDREGTLRTKPLPGIEEALIKMSKNGKVYVVTMRPKGRVDFAMEYLELQDLSDYICEFYSCARVEEGGLGKSKLQICSEVGIDVLIEDDARHLTEDFPGIKKILIKNGCDEKPELPEHIEYASNWYDVLNLLGL